MSTQNSDFISREFLAIPIYPSRQIFLTLDILENIGVQLGETFLYEIGAFLQDFFVHFHWQNLQKNLQKLLLAKYAKNSEKLQI